MNSSVDTWLMFAGRLHPVLVHFPIALILVAAFMEIFRLKRTQASGAALACLAFGALGASLAAFSGWRYALEGHGSKLPDSLYQHRWGAVAVAVLASLTWLIGIMARNKSTGLLVGWYRIGLIFIACLVSYVGHLGGELVYGSGHLWEVFEVESKQESKAGRATEAEVVSASLLEVPAKAEAATPRAVVDESVAPRAEADAEQAIQTSQLEAVVEQESRSDERQSGSVDYLTQIQPIFEASCYECHGPTGKAKGGLRLSVGAELLEGDSDYWILQPGDAARSLLVVLISGDPDSENVMPPMRGAEPAEVLSLENIELIKLWIDQGAKFDAQ